MQSESVLVRVLSLLAVSLSVGISEWLRHSPILILAQFLLHPFISNEDKVHIVTKQTLINPVEN